jgi:hypothetical protein
MNTVLMKGLPHERWRGFVITVKPVVITNSTVCKFPFCRNTYKLFKFEKAASIE